MSNHLSVLARAGLVVAEKNGRTVSYRADVSGFRGLIDFLAHDCCGGKPELCGLPVVPTASAPASSARYPRLPSTSCSCARRILRARSWPKRSFRRSGRKISRLFGRIPPCRGSASGSHRPSEVPRARRYPFALQVVERVHRSPGAAHGFRDCTLRHPQRQFCPDLGTKFVTGAWPVPDPAQFTGSTSERTTLLNELYAMILRRLKSSSAPIRIA